MDTLRAGRESRDRRRVAALPAVAAVAATLLLVATTAVTAVTDVGAQVAVPGSLIPVIVNPLTNILPSGCASTSATFVGTVNGTVNLTPDPGGGLPAIAGGTLALSRADGLTFAIDATLTPVSLTPSTSFPTVCAQATWRFTYDALLTAPGATQPSIHETGTAVAVPFFVPVSPTNPTGSHLDFTFTAATQQSLGPTVVAVPTPLPITYVHPRLGTPVTGWHRGPVTLNWLSTVVRRNGTVVTPRPVRVSADGITTVRSDRVCGRNGCAQGTATVRIDATGPVVSITGVVPGADYAAVPDLACTAADALNGAFASPNASNAPYVVRLFATCSTAYRPSATQLASGTAYEFFAESVDALGNQGVVRGTFTVGAGTTPTTTTTTAPTTSTTTTSPTTTTVPGPTTTAPAGGGLAVSVPATVRVGAPFDVVVSGAKPGAVVDVTFDGGAAGSLLVPASGSVVLRVAAWVEGPMAVAAAETAWTAGVPSVRRVATSMTVLPRA